MSDMHDDATKVAANDDGTQEGTQQQEGTQTAATTDEGAGTVTDADQGSDQADGTGAGTTDDKGSDEQDDAQQDQGIDMAALQADITKMVGNAVNKALSPYLPALKQVQANRDGARQTLINEIIANSNMTADQLKALADDALQALHGSLIKPVANYEGNGGLPTVNGANPAGSKDQFVSLQMPSIDVKG